MSPEQPLASSTRTRLVAGPAAARSLASANRTRPGVNGTPKRTGSGPHAPAGVPSSCERTSLAREGGPLDSIIPAGTDNFGAQQTPIGTDQPGGHQEVDR